MDGAHAAFSQICVPHDGADLVITSSGENPTQFYCHTQILALASDHVDAFSRFAQCGGGITCDYDASIVYEVLRICYTRNVHWTPRLAEQAAELLACCDFLLVHQIALVAALKPALERSSESSLKTLVLSLQNPIVGARVRECLLSLTTAVRPEIALSLLPSSRVVGPRTVWILRPDASPEKTVALEKSRIRDIIEDDEVVFSVQGKRLRKKATIPDVVIILPKCVVEVFARLMCAAPLTQDDLLVVMNTNEDVVAASFSGSLPFTLAGTDSCMDVSVSGKHWAQGRVLPAAGDAQKALATLFAAHETVAHASLLVLQLHNDARCVLLPLVHQSVHLTLFLAYVGMLETTSSQRDTDMFIEN